jgi:hypothetical protein
MKKKFLASLASLLVIAAVAVLPTAAQATEPCFTKSSPLCSSVKETPVEIYSWGTLTLKLVLGGTGEITCHNAAAGTIKNPVGGKGEGLTEFFSPYNCLGTLCPGTAAFQEVLAEKLPWVGVLEENSPPTIRGKFSGVKVNILCWTTKAAKETPGETPLSHTTFVGSNEPSLINKASAASPSLIEFDEGSGTLEVEGSSGTIRGKTEGHLSSLGYQHQEIIHAIKGP